jgi:hypothetical protein
LPKFTGASTIGNSNIQDSGTLVSVGVAANFSSSINLFSAGVDTGMLLTDASDFYLGAQTGKGLRLCTNNLGNTRLFISVSGNVGINTTNVSGTYEKLAVAGGISIKDNTNAKLEIGRYNTTGAQNSYIKLGANSNSLRFTNNTDTIDLMELTNSGTVFIGTTASTTYGTVVVVQNSVSSPNFVRGLQIVHPNGTGATGGYISMSNIGQKLGAIQVGDDLTTGNLVLNPVGGNVGINTNAVVKFQVNDGTNINLGIKVGQTDSSAVMLNAFNDGASANIPLEFRGSRFTFQNGNVGIGVTPNAWGGTNVKALEVYLASMSASLTWGSAFTFNTFYDGSNWKYIGPYTAGKYEIGGDEHIFSNAPGGTAGATATFTTRMQITATGKVQIGTGTPDGLLTINSTTTALSAITNADSSVKAGYFWHQATSGDNQLVQFFTDGGVQRGAIDFNRAAGLVRYLVTSDKNLKNVVGDSDKTQSVNILNSTKIREYFWKDDKSKKLQIGVIAQELHQTFKGAVSVGSDEQDLNKENYKTWSVDKTAFTFHLIAGFQEHERIIKELKQEIYNLKN